MRTFSAAAAALCVVSPILSAQCGTLSVAGVLSPGQTLTVDLANATPNAIVLLVAGTQEGTTNVDLGALGNFTIGVVQPPLLFPIGQTDASGHLSRSLSLPSGPASSLPDTLTLQTVAIRFTLSVPILSFCVSNTDTVERDVLRSREALARWHTRILDANALDTVPSTQGPLHIAGHHAGPGRTARAMAIANVAMFEALLAIEGGYDSYVDLAPASGPASRSAAIAQAAHDALVALYPSQSWIVDTALASDLASIANGPRKTNGMAIGAAAAAAILANRSGDGAAHSEPTIDLDFFCSNLPGMWRPDPITPSPTALGAHWGDVTPFALQSSSQFRAAPPPALTSAAYTAAFTEVKTLGGDGLTTPHQRTADQTRAAIYWGYDGAPGLGTPPRLFNQITARIARDRHTNALQTARLFALVNLALADAGIACWESKYTYQVWRPCSGIRQADVGTGPTGLGDGNPATVGDAAFSPLGAPASNSGNPNFTPPFPAYPSGHSTFGSALFQVLRRFYGTDAIAFTFVSDEWNGVTTDNQGNVRPLAPRSFTSLTAAEEENGQSRIWLGVHWSFDKTSGLVQGRAVADWLFDHLYAPVP